MAQATATFIRSVVAQRAGDPLEALREVGTFAALQSRLRRVTIAERLVDLGRPEQVSATIESVLAADDIDIFGAQALWLRGEVDLELAWPLAQQFPAMAKERNAAHEIVSVSGVVATIAIAAGEFDTARAIVQDARRFEACVGDHVVLMLDIAEAAVALCVDSEERAIEGLERSLERVPSGAGRLEPTSTASRCCERSFPTRHRCSMTATSAHPFARPSELAPRSQRHALDRTLRPERWTGRGRPCCEPTCRRHCWLSSQRRRQPTPTKAQLARS
ncbi:MAG: hypothetical protein R2710_13915 [Acidimicrobiales bacterium]